MGEMSLKEKLDTIVRAYDVRGVVPDQLDEEVAELLGRGFAKYVSAKYGNQSAVLCGQDMRLSSPSLSQAFRQAILLEGVKVIDLGLISSDLLFFATGKFDLPGAIFTASHNPPSYNGIKFCDKAAGAIGLESGLEKIKELALELKGIPKGSSSLEAEKIDLMGDFLTHIKSQVDFEKLTGLKLVVDAANGMGGPLAAQIFAGMEMELLYGEPDGSFPNHPADPLNPKNLKDLQKRVKAKKADLGLAFDGDADRVFLVDEKGQILSGSTTTALIAAHLLSENKGETVAYNLICSKSVPEAISKFGGVPLKTKVGHSHIKQIMSESGAIFAGEHSGHFYFRDNFGADSGILAALHAMESLVEFGKPLSQLKLPFESYENSGELSFEALDPVHMIQELSQHYSNFPQEHLDGLSVDLDSWWFNLRSSNTEPVVRLNLEANSRKEFKRGFAEVKKAIRQFCSSI